MKTTNTFYKEFKNEELKKLPVSHQMLTVFRSETDIITSESGVYEGIYVKKYNTILLGGAKHYSPISKIVDFG